MQHPPSIIEEEQIYSSDSDNLPSPIPIEASKPKTHLNSDSENDEKPFLYKQHEDLVHPVTFGAKSEMLRQK